MKRKIITIIIVLLLICVGGFIGDSVLRSPEYALTQISKDIKTSGIQGLKPHLTGNAKTIVDSAVAISENKIVNSIVSSLNTEDSIGALKSNLKEIEWSLIDILKNKRNATAILGFNYKDNLTGTVDILMIYEENGWKIKDIELSKIQMVE